MANNVIDTTHDVGLDLEWCEDSTIVGNTVRNCETAGIALFLSCKNVAITGNSIVVNHSKVGMRDGIWLTSTNKSIFKNDNGHRFISITANTIIAEGPPKHGINIGSGNHITCMGNVMENADILDRTGNVSLSDAGSAVVDDALTVIPLSQAWQFKTEPGDEGVKAGWFKSDLNDSDWAIIHSNKNFGWELQGFGGETGEGYTGYGWYRAELPKLPKGIPTFMYMYFDAVDEQAWVYLNGKLIGEHTTESTERGIDALWDDPFCLEIKEHLKLDSPNLLAVRVHNAALRGGIWRPVYLVFSDIAASISQQRKAINFLAPKQVETNAPNP